MSLTDPIGDMIARIKNAQVRNHKKVDLPSSKFKIKILDILKAEGFIIDYKISDENVANKQEVTTDKIATILLNSDRDKWLEKKYGYKQWNPTEKDLKIIQNVLDDAIKNNEFDFLKKPIRQSINKYYRQYIPYVNINGERIIEINAFCEILKLPPNPKSKNQEWTEMDWKKQYVMVDDGGNCYWRIQINIDTKEYYNLMINGVA